MSNKNTTILVTGATGFVGQHLCRYLLTKGYSIKAVGRKPSLEIMHPNLTYIRVEGLHEQTDWATLFQGVGIVVHLAGRAHQSKEQGMQHLALYQQENVKTTQWLAKAAIQYDVKRFIYLSTIKVIGEKTVNIALRAEDQPRPQDPYSVSKLQAEQILQEESRRSGMEWVIIRPPLIYGSLVKGNFRKLLKLAKTKFPLPFGATSHRRSFVSITNLCSFIECCMTHPYAQREVFLVSDNHDLTCGELIGFLRKAMHRKTRIFPMPLSVLKLLGLLAGKRNEVNKMTDALQINIEKSTRLLGWQVPYSVEDSFKALFEEERLPYNAGTSANKNQVT